MTAGSAKEEETRRRLGIPGGARQVLLLGESSHWDPDWLLTAGEYYRLRIRRILNKALSQLAAEPGRVFSIECVFFLKMYWEREPARRDEVRELINSGRLRLTGSGLTTPDTLLPETEVLLRDYLLGQQWLRDNGLHQEPRVAYFPDSFGHSPALPSLLRALGVEYAAFSRLDGMHFAGTDYRRAKDFPLPGSNAELLSKKLKTADFRWRAPDGAEVLTHWHPYSYFHGDTLTSVGAGRWMGLTAGVPVRTAGHVAKRIGQYAAQLGALAKTPYLFCPLGGDFNGPVRGLVGLIHRYNETEYPKSGLFVVNAALDDYFDLISAYRNALPVLDLDPNPYWMGFYASRPEMKQRCRKLGRSLVAAEARLAAKSHGNSGGLARSLSPAWEIAAAANHHDFITGTSPERVWRKEQRPWLEKAQALADENEGEDSVPPKAAAPAWRREGSKICVTTPHAEFVFDENAGGCLVSWKELPGKKELLSGPSLDLLLYKDSGGLWRLGHEYAGGTFSLQEQGSKTKTALSLSDQEGRLVLGATFTLGGREVSRRVFVEAGSPAVRVEIEGSVGRYKTLTCAFSPATKVGELLMDVPGGVVRRPPQKIFFPTFWCAQSALLAEDGANNAAGLEVGFSVPAAVSAGEQHVEWIVLRNAPREKAFGFLPVLAHPASGPDPHVHTLSYTLTPARNFSGGWEGLRQAPLRLEGAEGVRLLALKPAEDGAGDWVARLYAPQGPWPQEAVLSWEGGEITGAFLCDALEREIEPLGVETGKARAPVTGAIASIRIRL